MPNEERFSWFELKRGLPKLTFLCHCSGYRHTPDQRGSWSPVPNQAIRSS